MVIKWDVTIPRLSGDTPQSVHLSSGKLRPEEPDRRYPVMYMFDGHNVFFDEDATFGKSWGHERLHGAHRKQLIIVGVECNPSGQLPVVGVFPCDLWKCRAGEDPGQGQHHHELDGKMS